MKKYTKIASLLVFSLVILPGVALAHDDGDHDDGEIKIKHERKQKHEQSAAFSGTVTTVSATGFTIQTKSGGSVTVNVNSDTKIMNAYGTVMALADIKVNDRAHVRAKKDDGTITAKSVFISPANTHPASIKGTVTAVSGDTLTVESQHKGVVYQTTVKTDTNTSVKNSDGATTTAAISVGTPVKVGGLWDEILKVLKAIRIKIR